MKLGTLILAAGHGKRTATDIPKPLLPLQGKTLVDFVMQAVNKAASDSKCDINHHVLVGHKSELVAGHIKSRYSDAECILQSPQLGTGHAVQVFIEHLKREIDYVLIICADTPLIASESIQALIAKAIETKCEAVVAVVDVEDATGYGRVFEKNGQISIIEHKDLDPTLYNHKTINTGLYVFNVDFLKKNIGRLTNQNASNEYYLTDVFKFSKNALSIKFKDQNQFWGINTLEQLAESAKELNKRKISELMKSGVIFADPNNSYVHQDVQIGKNTYIESGVSIKNATVIGMNCRIQQGSIVDKSILQEGVEILPYCVINDSLIEKNAHVGPFAHLRPGSSLGAEVKVGNFVEVKKARFEKGAKASHLSYVGDAQIGENTNLGCGFITCNYDGVNKHKTVIGRDCFIGSDTQLVAPVELGDRCFVAAGSTITQSMPDDAFGISRGRQSVKEGMARKFIKTKIK
jgi:bifunctional UDP-N-acetylglucosamine pyrophosphorylase/glucosamine-1-phosphate N-acetyltransferase